MAEAPTIAALLLAAGGSSRLGRSKQLLSYRGSTLVRRSAELLCGLASNVVVVTGASAGEVEEQLQGLELYTSENSRWREGVGTSISLGVRDLPPEVDGLLLLLCDQYRVRAEDLQNLHARWLEQPDRIVASKWAGAFGPPVIFPREHFRQLGRLSGDLGARRLLVEHRTRAHFVSMENAAYDVDEPADIDTLRAFENP